MVLLRRPFLCFSGSVERCVWMKGRHSDTNVYYTGNECMTVNVGGGHRRVVVVLVVAATAFFLPTHSCQSGSSKAP